MSGPIRRVAALTASISLVAILVLGATPFTRAGVVVQVASITIVKVTDPAVVAQDFAYSLNGSPFGILLDTDPTSLDVEDSRELTVEADDFGPYVITEADVSGFLLTDIQCTGDAEVEYNVAASNVILDVHNGDEIVCRFYNTEFASLSIRKNTLPVNDPQPFDFDLTGEGGQPEITLDTDNVSDVPSGYGTDLAPDEFGAYTITESAVDGWALIDLQCTGAGADSSVNVDTRTATLDIDAGEDVLCTFTNAKLPLVTVTKATVPASDPQDFYLEIPGDRNTTLDTDPESDVPNSETWSLAGNLLGERDIVEGAVDGWTLASITCSGGSVTSKNLTARSVTFELEADTNIACTFTNMKDTAPTDNPPTPDPTMPDPTTPESTSDEAGATNAVTPPGTDTQSTDEPSSSMPGFAIGLLAVILLSATLLATRPKRSST